jgi:hypothetical protein
MVRTAVCSLAAAVLVSVFAAACGGDSDTKTVTRTVVDAGPTRPPIASVTGDGTIDQIIDAVVRADDIALAGLSGYQRVPCKIGTPEELAGAPPCRDAETDGTAVEVLASTACTNGWIRPEQVPDAYRYNLAPDKPQLILVFKPLPGPTTYGNGFGATTTIVARTRTSTDGQPGGVALHINNGRIAWVEASCLNISELTAPDRIESVIYDPANPAGSTTPAVAPDASSDAGVTADASAPADGEATPEP